jgi:carboxylesterase type B
VSEVRTAANPEPFVTEHPKDIIRSGEFNRVPFVMGSNSEEGGFFLLREFRVKHAAYVGAIYMLKGLGRKIEVKNRFGRPGNRWDSNIYLDLRE